jgi:hypothetical protein
LQERKAVLTATIKQQVLSKQCIDGRIKTVSAIVREKKRQKAEWDAESRQPAKRFEGYIGYLEN